MRKRGTWRHPKKILFNCLLIVVMLVLLYIGDGLPALTKTALVKDILRDNLMHEGELIWEEKDWQGYGKLYVLSGDTVVRASCRRDVLSLGYSRWNSEILYGNDGVTCVPSCGTPGEFLVMGNLPEASSAVLELQIRKNRQGETHRVYTMEGLRDGEKVISFTVAEIHEDDEKFFDSLRKTVYPEGYYNYTLWLYDTAGKEIGQWTDLPEKTEENP